jgi:RNA polymerase sigma-70 factor (ECF subfamily)
MPESPNVFRSSGGTIALGAAVTTFSSATPSTDAALVERVRIGAADDAALDLLVRRHWRKLFARCRMLTQDADAANELAQEAWFRVLQARHRLDPAGNFPAYITTVATNLWRDHTRAARRAGALAEERLSSLDAVRRDESGDQGPLADVLPDPMSLDAEDRHSLSIDLDRAMAELTPRARDVLIARFIDGESAAEIGRRYGRTEQTITSWIRQACEDVRRCLGSAHTGRAVPAQHSGRAVAHRLGVERTP